MNPLRKTLLGAISCTNCLFRSFGKKRDVMYAFRFPPSIIMCASFWDVFLLDRHFEWCSFESRYRIDEKKSY